MKKKVKDFTIGEWHEICRKCPNICCEGCVFEDCCPFNQLSQKDLETEIEVEENGK